jgi:hypothetical protein
MRNEFITYLVIAIVNTACAVNPEHILMKNQADSEGIIY